MELLVGLLLIFFARVTDVSLATIRTLFIFRGRRIPAAAAGFFEALVYILALGKVFQNLDNPLSLLVYSLGFAMGNYVGCFLEEKLAYGYLTVQAISLSQPEELAMALREQGFGVTIIDGQGREGSRQILNVVLKRKDINRLFALIDEIDKKAFVTVFDARSTRGGVTLRKQNK